MPRPTLYHASFSPWSEKARWALDLHRVDLRRVEYIPMLSEPMLRMQLGRWTGHLTVPVVVGASEPLDDSLAIARWAERQGGRALLFGPGLDAAIDEWNQRSESVLSAGRALATRRVAGDAEARREMLPPVIPPRLRGLLLPLADTGVAYLTRKYRLDDTADHVALLAMRRALEASRHAIGVGGGFHLAGRLTYADVAMATALQMVRPPAAPWARLGPASRRCFTHDQLCEEFADLLDWRDDLYGRFRSPGAVQA